MMNPSSAIFFLLTITIFFTHVISTQTISYSHHCSSFAPEAIPTQVAYTRYPYLEPGTSHYTGGQKILGKDASSHTAILLKGTRNVFMTNITDTYKVEARLTFFPSDYSQLNRTDRPQLVFFLDGFWSVPTNNLCMVGSARWFKEGNPLQLDAVLKLKMASYMTLKTSLVSGILESLASPYDSDYFEPISMMGFPLVAPFKYSYTIVSNEEFNGGNSNTQQDSATSMQTIDICSSFYSRTRTYQLQYPSSCSSIKNCTPFGQDSPLLPSFLALNGIQCSSADKKLRFLVEFQDRRHTPDGESFNPNITLIGEGTWNGTKDELCIVACRILNQNDPMAAHVGDCSTRLTLWYPAVQSIKKTHSTEGQIWTTKSADDIGYFETIKLRSFSHNFENYGLKYEFTQMKKVRRFCPIEKHAKREGDNYPSGYGHHQHMEFRISVRHKNEAFSGFVIAISVGDRVHTSGTSLDFNRWQTAQTSTTARSTTSQNGPLNVRYEIAFTLNMSSTSGNEISSLKLSETIDGVAISAEGLYDDETGQLCMVGCRKLHDNSLNVSFDCDILVRIQLPPINGDGGSFLKGSIESLRKETDILYFEHLDVFSPTYIPPPIRTSTWRMDLEVIMILISDIFSCIFIVRLLFHVKKRPEMVPSISVLMMLILALGHMVPPVLNFEGIISKTHIQNDISLETIGGWLEIIEMVVKTVSMVAFILQFHLLHLIWTAKPKPNNNDGNQKNPWISEMQTLIICLTVYIVGALTMFLVNWKNNNSIWGDLRSYAGLTLDGFLLPQLILNMLQISKGNALSHSFYIGTTFVRLLPHGYDLYRGPNNISHQFYRLYIYANPQTDFDSPSWDVVICCGGIVFAVVIFLQQRIGGRFLFPKRFRESAKLITHCL